MFCSNFSLFHVTLRVYELTISTEDVNIELLKQVHEESVDLRKEPNEENHRKTQSKD